MGYSSNTWACQPNSLCYYGAWSIPPWSPELADEDMGSTHTLTPFQLADEPTKCLQMNMYSVILAYGYEIWRPAR